jgi:hypothetical protein
MADQLERELRVIEARGENTPLVINEGTRLNHTYYEVPINLYPVEVPDERLLDHLERAGCFEYLAEPGEDVYSLEDGEPV